MEEFKRGDLVKIVPKWRERPEEAKALFLVLEDREHGLLVADLQQKLFCGFGIHQWPRECFEKTGFNAGEFDAETIAAARAAIDAKGV